MSDMQLERAREMLAEARKEADNEVSKLTFTKAESCKLMYDMRITQRRTACCILANFICAVTTA